MTGFVAPFRPGGVLFLPSGAPFQPKNALFQPNGAPFLPKNALFQPNGAPFLPKNALLQPNGAPFLPKNALLQPKSALLLGWKTALFQKGPAPGGSPSALALRQGRFWKVFGVCAGGAAAAWPGVAPESRQNILCGNR
jgi:hypothetical protein